ncbi:MAG TPA: isoprenylcysteine carboxylmethyltransferase family protein [Steroidobacteraceae bacterium]|jgi:protein-S-isoprenylcysteine O-methyltransferase Ste14|nr:isoprenylcysteine carboxylmethyltransferase family protein [Steroidobacteraceae bacterium]
MRFLAAQLILALWLVWGVYWLITAFSAKPTRRREPRWSRWAFVAQALLVAALLGPHRWRGWLGVRIVPGGWSRYWIGVAVIVAGLLLCIWARRALGGNWSGAVTVKVGHELVQGGPYRWVRHPIYTGILLMMLGTALAGGEVHGLLAVSIATLALWLRSRVEERWMSEEFGEQYARYRQRSWALIPYIV